MSIWLCQLLDSNFSQTVTLPFLLDIHKLTMKLGKENKKGE